jgi:hypothetical protein
MTCLSDHRVAVLTDESISQLSRAYKLPAFALNSYLGWQFYFKTLTMMNSSSPLKPGANPNPAIAVDHHAAFQQNMGLIRLLEVLDR